MLITGSFAGGAVPLEVDASCRTAAALKEQVLRELPQLEDAAAFDVTFQGHVLDDAAVCGLEEGCTVVIAASRASAARSELRRRGLWVSEKELFRAAGLGDVAVCRLLLDAGVPACGSTADRGFRVLAHAALAHHSKVCALLIESGCSVDVSDTFGCPAIWCALEDAETCKVFLDAGSSGEDDRDGRTLLDAAVQNGNTDVVALLLKHGANPSGTSASAETPLQYSMDCEHDAMCRVLIEGGCDVEECGGDGNSPLAMAAHKNNVAVCTLLLEHGASLSAESDEDPLEIAERHGFSELCSLFEKNGAKRA